jgi:ABC-type transport system involved in cytochrome bd biosynthesis fused ATPase/permease subunit
MLGELDNFTGGIGVSGKVFYISQQAWIFPASLKQNILFGMPYDKEKFDKVVEVCSLKKV